MWGSKTRLLNTCSVPGTVLGTPDIPPHWKYNPILWGGCPYPHFIDKELAYQLSDLLTVTKLESHGPKNHSWFSKLQSSCSFHCNLPGTTVQLSLAECTGLSNDLEWPRLIFCSQKNKQTKNSTLSQMCSSLQMGQSTLSGFCSFGFALLRISVEMGKTNDSLAWNNTFFYKEKKDW